MKITESLLEHIISDDIFIEICINNAITRVRRGKLSKTADGLYFASNGEDNYQFPSCDVSYIWKNQYGYSIHVKKEEDIDYRFYERKENDYE